MNDYQNRFSIIFDSQSISALNEWQQRSGGPALKVQTGDMTVMSGDSFLIVLSQEYVLAWLYLST